VREVIVHFEQPDAGDRDGSLVCGFVVARDVDSTPVRFEGWLQLMGHLEEFSLMVDDRSHPPGPRSGLIT
jgi:hypothetical protein